MEVINLSSYTIQEKNKHSKAPFAKRAIEDTGLAGKGIEFTFY